MNRNIAEYFLATDNTPIDRSVCRTCQKSIEMGSVRIAQGYRYGSDEHHSWYHPNCLPALKKILNKDAMDVQGYHLLKTNADRMVVEKTLSQMKRGNQRKSTMAFKRNKRRVQPLPTIPEVNDSERESFSTPCKENESDNGNSCTNTNDQSNLPAKMQVSVLQLYFDQFMKMDIRQLKAVLDRNDQPKNGSKNELAERCASGRIMGRTPRCGDCGGGRLKWNHIAGEFICCGYMNDDEFVYCGRKFNRTEIKFTEWL